MTDETRNQDLEALTPEELEAQGGEELPDREAMSLVNANVAAPVNAAVARTCCPTTRPPSPTRRRTPRSTSAN